MNKTIVLILCFSVVSLAVGIFVGYRINPIKDETIEEIDKVVNSLEEISDIAGTDVNLIRTKSFVSIFIDLLRYLRNNDQESAISIVDSSLRDIRSELTRDLESDYSSEDERLLVELIDANLNDNYQVQEDKK